jgi:hypothetical protein
MTVTAAMIETERVTEEAAVTGGETSQVATAEDATTHATEIVTVIVIVDVTTIVTVIVDVTTIVTVIVDVTTIAATSVPLIRIEDGTTTNPQRRRHLAMIAPEAVRETELPEEGEAATLGVTVPLTGDATVARRWQRRCSS